MTRTRIALLAALLVAAGFLAYQRYQQMAEEQAAEAAREASAKILQAMRSQRALAEGQDARLPHIDRAMSRLRGAFPRPASAWQSAEKASYESLLSRGHFDVLVVPFQVQDFGFDRSTRSLMTAELAEAVSAAQKKVADPYLVARTLGDGQRRLNPDDVRALARKLQVGNIVWGYAGYLGKTMRITIQREDPRKPLGALEARHFENLPFSDEDPPIEVYQRLLPELLKAIGIDSPAPAGVESRFDANDIPLSPLRMASEGAEPARDAYAFQLLATLTPSSAERTRERFTEKSMLAILGMSPASPDYRVLKARALMQMGERPAALKALGTPDSDEAKHLFALLNGNLPDVERYSARIKPKMPAFIARLELNGIAVAYGSRTQKGALDEARKLKLPGSIWPFLAARALTDWDMWSQYDNVAIKRLLDHEFPIPGFTAEEMVRGAASLGNVDKLQTAFDLSVLDHVRKFSEGHSAEWCCRPLAARPAESDYLDLLEAIGTDNLIRRARFLVTTQGSPQAALDFLARIESAYRDQPWLTAERARAELALAKQTEGASKTGFQKSAYEHAYDAFYWEQGQTRNAADAWNLLNESGRRDYGFLDNLYASDFPFRPFYPPWEVTDANRQMANEEAALRNSTFDFYPVTLLSWTFEQMDKNWGRVDELLKSIDDRFAGNPQRTLLLAQNSVRKNDMASAQRYYRENIKSQPRYWQAYWDLGKILFEDVDVTKAAQVFMSYPEFRKRSGENAVGLSNQAFDAGSLFYWSGNFAQAMPLYRISAGLQTGSNASLSSEIRLNLARGDYVAALTESLERARRYNSQFAYRDYLGMLHAMGHSTEAWDAFNVLIGQMTDSELWETPLVGHRKAGASESEIAQWVAREPVSKTGYAGMYLLRAGVTDRIPTKELSSSLAAVARPAWKTEGADGYVFGGPVIRGFYRILSAKEGFVPAEALDKMKKTPVKSDLAYFAEAYRSMRLGDFAQAKGIFDEMLALYDLQNADLEYLLPYYAFAATKAGDSQSVPAYLQKFEVPMQRFDYYLTLAVTAGLGGKTSESLKYLELARHRRPFTQSRPLYTEYEFGEICEWLYQATKNPKFRDVAVSWARSVEGFAPWFAWPYAMEARLTPDRNDRARATAMAYYLDRKSERLAKIPKSEIDIAVKQFAGRNPFLKTQRSPKESST